MKQIQYLTDKGCLAFFHKQATPAYWDMHWDRTDLRARIQATTTDPIFTSQVKRLVPAGGLVVEGGSGPAMIVNAMVANGYRCIGIDFAEETVKAVREAVPELDVRVGDVRKLELESDSADAYISGGVIEHFWEGYQPIISEMYRVLKPGGYLFITFPYMSPLRRLKSRLRGYSHQASSEVDKDSFYQFALSHKQVLKDLQALGFRRVEQHAMDGIKGFKDTLPVFKPLLQPMYDAPVAGLLRRVLNRILTMFAGHVMLLIMQK